MVYKVCILLYIDDYSQFPIIIIAIIIAVDYTSLRPLKTFPCPFGVLPVLFHVFRFFITCRAPQIAQRPKRHVVAGRVPFSRRSANVFGPAT
jgi:hypothetical protein